VVKSSDYFVLVCFLGDNEHNRVFGEDHHMNVPLRWRGNYTSLTNNELQGKLNEEMTTRDKLRLTNLLIGFLNLYYWHMGSSLFVFIVGCLNIGVFVFGKK